MRLRILSGGAAQGLIEALAPRFKAETGFNIAGSFGAVGSMRDKLMAGEPVDLVLLTSAIIAELVRQGAVVASSASDIGSVHTAVAVRAGDEVPAIDTPDRLRAALLAADAIYFPDPQQATAGIHFAKVLGELGIAGEALAAKVRSHPDGATAMRALASSRAGRPIGCTQATEIRNTPGLSLLGPLPAPFQLATVYTAAVCTRAAAPRQAEALSALIRATDTAGIRSQAGFERLP
jgi:molybdate transport system substrate-binding protein